MRNNNLAGKEGYGPVRHKAESSPQIHKWWVVHVKEVKDRYNVV
jgi:hypothetical protein